MYPGAHAATTPDRAAQIYARTGEVTTFAELDAAANRIANLFTALGLQPGDHIAFCLENHPRFLELAWGAHYAGLYYTAASSRLTAGELAYIVNDCAAKVFICSKYKSDVAEEMRGDASLGTPGVAAYFMLDGTIDGYEPWESAVAAQPVEPQAALQLGHHRSPERRQGGDEG
jgi:long-chain acyl-CoA synthetase